MELWHITNRGVEGRDLFLDTQDYARFVHDLYEFNDLTSARAHLRTLPNVGHRKSYIRERLVEIHGWVLMKNHYHLLVSELVEGGLVQFLRKLNIGYAKYFNERYERKGTLFQGRTKKVLVSQHAHFLYVLHYVHLNPLDYVPASKNWRERDKGEVHEVAQALAYLKKYRWSSYKDYCGEKNFPSILSRHLFAETFPNYERAVEEYLRGRSEPAPAFKLEYED